MQAATFFATDIVASETGNRVEINFGKDGSALSMQFHGDSTEYSSAYLLLEGIFLHAKLNPTGLCLRIPDLKEPSRIMDVSYEQAASIVESLTISLREQLYTAGIIAGPGTTIAVLTLPYAHSFFHLFALWQLDCGVQWFNHELGRDAMDAIIGWNTKKEIEGASALFYYGLSDEEEISLGIAHMSQRIGVKPIKLQSLQLAVKLAQKQDWLKPRQPKSQEEFDAEINQDRVFFLIHTSGSTGIPKIVQWTIFGISRFLKLPPHVMMDQNNSYRPLLMISRAYWGSSSFLLLFSITTGCSLAYCYPEDRLYPTTKQALDSAALYKAGSLLLYPAQVSDLYEMVLQSKHYADIVSSIPTIQWCGAGLDEYSSAKLASLDLDNVCFLNIHGMSEVGFTGMISSSYPYDGLRSMTPYALWESLDDDDDSYHEQRPLSRLVKLWISLDKHPVAWYMIAKGLSPITAERFPGQGPDHNRPAVDTGDIFEERIDIESGECYYFHHSRDDDLIRLSNLFRPNVGKLEAIFEHSLTSVGRLPLKAIDAIQILGDKKPKMALVLQLRESKLREVSRDCVEDAIAQALVELDDHLPKKVQFAGMERIKIVFTKDEDPSIDVPNLLLKTHKGNLRRRINVNRLAEWHDSLDQQNSV